MTHARLPLAAVVATVLLGYAAIAVLLPTAPFAKYTTAATKVLDGTLDAERLVDFSPLYLPLHVAAERIGVGGEGVRWLQVGLATLVCAWVFVLARRRMGLGLALLATALVAFDRQLIVYSQILEPELVLVASTIGMLAAVEVPGPRWAAVGGICAALGIATRPTLLPIALAVPVYQAWRARETPGTRWPREAAVFLLPVALVLVGLGWRSHQLTGDWRTPVMNPGTVFFEGNHPQSRGTSAFYPPIVDLRTRQPAPADQPDRAHVYYRQIARLDSGPELDVRGVNAYWQGKAMAFVRDHPATWLRRVVGKLELALHGGRLHDVATAWLLDQRLGRLPTTPFAVLVGLALVGVLTAARHRRRDLLLLLLAASQLAVMLALYASARQRLLLVPIFALFAAQAIGYMWRHRSIGLAALAGLVATGLSLPHPLIEEQDHRTAGSFAADGAMAGLRDLFAREPAAWHTRAAVAALAHKPWRLDDLRMAYLSQAEGTIPSRLFDELVVRGGVRPAARLDLSTVALAAGRTQDAEALLATLDAQGYTPYRVGLPTALGVYQAQVALAEGDQDRAHTLLEVATETAPGEPYVLALRVALDPDGPWRDRLRRYWSSLDTDWLVGQAALDANRPDLAEPALASVVRQLPMLRKPKLYLAAALAGTGRLDEGVEQVRRAMDISVDPIALDPLIPDLFVRWSEASPPAEETARRLEAAQLLHRYGHLTRATAVLDGVATDQGDPAARRLLDQTRARIRVAQEGPKVTAPPRR